MHDRMRLLIARLRAANISSDASLRSGFVALRLGRDVLRLRALLAADPASDQLARDALSSIAGPERAAALARTAAALRARAAGLDAATSAEILRAAAILPSIDALVAGAAASSSRCFKTHDQRSQFFRCLFRALRQ